MCRPKTSCLSDGFTMAKAMFNLVNLKRHAVLSILRYKIFLLQSLFSNNMDDMIAVYKQEVNMIYTVGYAMST